ncbi:fructose-bisphosphate aldolase-like [Nilaparvata lugens]|uniref:fructose-bisphosphate aldolase-like n=1 Tax=Nilaparvata lugens TaxID=108931 RepID=UPI00193E9F4D|nr:fructose-bisphosphate aldolase-like [Nilaparvata lugens]
MKKRETNSHDHNWHSSEFEEDVNIPHHKFHWDPKQLQSEMPYLSERFSSNFETSTALDELRDTVNKIMATGKSILNCDDSVKLGDLLVRCGLHNNEENRRRFRNVLFNPQTLYEDSLGSYVSLVVLGHEALFQKSGDGQLLRDILTNQGILFAIQVDKGSAPMYNSSTASRNEREMIVEGLDDLDKRCLAYRKAGCSATKVTAVFRVGAERPSTRAIQDNVRALARFASVCQAYCLVPIIACELASSGDNDVDKTERAMELILVELMVALADQEVLLEATLVAPNMCTPGRDCTTHASVTAMACASVLTIRRTIPPAVAGIAFLTTGQDLEEGCVNLDAISNVKVCKPWPITSISGEALLNAVMSVWNGHDSSADKARNELMKWAMITSLAVRGVFINVEEESRTESNTETSAQV